MIENHRHTWVHAADQPAPPTQWVCTDCDATGPGCIVCGHILETHGRTCDSCVSNLRNDLRNLRDMYRQLPDVIAAAAGLHAVRYDQRGGGKTKKPTDTSIIGGAAFVLAGPGNGPVTVLGREENPDDPMLRSTIRELAAAEQADPPSVYGVLTFHEDEWRSQQRQPAATKSTVDAAVEYLVVHVKWAAQHADPDTWAAFLADINALRGRLRNLTGHSAGPVKAGVPCMYCSGTVVQDWHTDGLGDVRRCTRCGITWETEARFMLAVREAHQALPTTHPDELVTIDDAKRIYKGRVRPARFNAWVSTGVLPPARDGDGRPRRDERGDVLYHLATIDLHVTSGEEAS